MHEGSPDPTAAAEWSLAAVQKLLWARRWLIAAVAAEVFVITGLVTVLRTPLYDASARLVIERSAPKVLQGEDVLPTLWSESDIQRFYQTQYLLLKDPALLRQALDRHGVRGALQAALARQQKRAEGDERAPGDATLASYIRGGLRVEQIEYSNMVRVSFRDPSPEVAANVVNAVVETYRDFFVNSGLDARRGASQFLKKAIEDAQVEVMDLDASLGQARRQFTTVMPGGGVEMGKTRLESIDAELTQAKAGLAKSEARLNAYGSAPPDGVDGVRNNTQVARFRESLAELKKEQADLAGRVGPDWPRQQELQAAVTETERNLAQEVQRVYQQVLQVARADVEQNRQSVERLGALFEQELRRTADSQAGSSDYERLRQAYEQKRQSLDRLLARREDVTVSAGLKDVVERQVSIIEAARAPERPASPRTRLNLMLGLAFGLFLGVAAAFVAEALDNKVRTGQQLADISRLPLLGSIPRLEGPARPRLIFSRDRRASAPVMAARHHDIEEAFRALRSALLLAKAGRPPQVLMVSSAVPGEGKSTIVGNLGRTLAAFGCRTVLIDCDLRHPRLHRLFDLQPERGLTNVLASSVPVSEVLLKTPYDGLHLVPGGPCPPDPATLLDPGRLRQMIAELQGSGFEFALIDTPPLLVFADAFNLVPAVEGVIAIARAQSTPKDALRQMLDALRKVQAPLIGVVLNGEVTAERSGSYYRYYHYRRGYYRRAAESRPPEGQPPAPLGAEVQSGDQHRAKAVDN